MADWNEQSAPNNNLQSETLKSSRIIGEKGLSNQGFTEELSDGGERDKVIEKQLKRRQPGMG